MAGASAYFEGGITTYNLEQKVTHLGIDRAPAASVNCVSPRVAIQMAHGVRFLFRDKPEPTAKHWAVATTGYAEPLEALPVPHAYIAVTNGSTESVRRIEAPIGLTRTQTQQFFAEQALLFFLEVVGTP